MTSHPALSSIRGIIFDLDGTLYHMKWFMRVLFFVRLLPKGQWLPRYMKLRAHFAGKDFGSREALLAAMADDLARQSRVSRQRILGWFEKSFYPGFVDIMPFFEETRPRVNELLAALRAKSIKLAVLSDFSRIAERLTALRIDPNVFDALISAEDEGALKPNPRPFLAIAKAWDIPAGEVLVIGDRDDTDGLAATASGMQFLQITDKRHTNGKVLRWDAIRDLLQSIDSGSA